MFFCLLEQQQLESDSTMTVETQQNHDRLHGKSGIANNVVPSDNLVGMKTTVAGKQKEDEYKRFAENTMKVCNVNMMENTLASRY